MLNVRGRLARAALPQSGTHQRIRVHRRAF